MKIQKYSLAVLAAAGVLAFSMPVHADNTTPAAPAAPAATNAPAAPPAGGPPGGRGRMMSIDAQLDRLNQTLTLTDDQKPKVKTVLEDQMKSMQDLRGDTSMSTDDRRAKMMAIRQDTMTKMKGILTDDQFTKYQAMMPTGRGPGGRRGPAGGTNAPAGGAGAPPQQ